jgi:UDP-N-acetylmuramate dehydrogenase
MTARIRDDLPRARGSYTENAPLNEVVWFRAAGPSEVLFRPADREDLRSFLAACADTTAVNVIGVGSNLLVRDGGIKGVVIRLPSVFGRCSVEGNRVRVGAAALDSAVARTAAGAGIAGLEFLRGIPGTVGGALRMNAGCYGREISDVLVEAMAIDRQGRELTLSRAEMDFSYRKSGAPADLVFVEALLEGTPDDPEAIRGRMDALVEQREATQPVRAMTGGSTFKNPPPELSGGRKAWQLIDEAGCRGLAKGAARVSDKHCNFLINTGGASAGDLESLGEEVRARVLGKSGIDLEWEIRRLGTP